MSSRFLGVNRNKKSVTLDLRNPVCKGAFEKLVANSDVLLDNWGPGAFQRLGLGYDRLSEINPRLIYAEITGYGDGARGPYSDWPANNLAIQAMSGWMEVTGEPGGAPQAVGDNIGDSVPGVWAALGIVLALETRRQTGVGQHVDVAMYECMVSHLISNMNAYQVTGPESGRIAGRTRQASLGPGTRVPGRRRLRRDGRRAQSRSVWRPFGNWWGAATCRSRTRDTCSNSQTPISYLMK